VSLSEFKKSQYLLEESKFYLSNEVDDLKKENKILEQKLKYEKTSNILLIIFTVILLTISATIWFINIG
jgi:CRISPR-associated protein Cas8b1/Cst1 subtype I-B